MNALRRTDPALLAGALFAGLNLAHLLAWAFGMYVPVQLHALLLAAALVYAVWRPQLLFIVIVGTLLIFVLITLNAPVTGWDARSIWFFHGKRIFLGNSLYAQLDNYAPWTHNVYPTLVPAMAASIARSIGYWNEIAPRASVALVLAPAMFLGACYFRSLAAYCLWLTAMLLSLHGHLIIGYMDAAVAVYFALSLLAMAGLYQGQRQGQSQGQGSTGSTPVFQQHGVVLLVALLHLLFLKNEGLALSVIVSVCLLPLLRRSWHLAGLVLLAFGLFAVVWKVPTLLAGIDTDLARDGGLLERGLQRLRSIDDVYRIVKYFLTYGKWYALLFGLVGAAVLLARRRLGHLLAPLVAAGAYAALLFGVYLTTYHDQAWHLQTSADRVLLAFNFGVATVALLALCTVLADNIEQSDPPRGD